MKKLSILLIFVLLLTLAVGCTERQPRPCRDGTLPSAIPRPRGK